MMSPRSSRRRYMGGCSREGRAGLAEGVPLAVEGVLRGVEAVGKQRFDGVRRPVDEVGQLFALGGREVVQHVVGRILPTRRPSDAETDAQVVVAPQRRGGGAQAVVAAITATSLDPQRAIGQVEVIVHN